MLWCDRQALVKSDGFTVEVAALPCRCWDCEHCVHLNKRKVKKLAKAGRPNTFVTLTLPDDPSRSYDEQAQQLVKALRQLRNRAEAEARRDPGRRPQPTGPAPRDGWKRDEHGRVPRQVRLVGPALPVLVVLEAHQSGKPHVHVIARSHWIGFDWLQANWHELTGAHRVEVKRVRTIGGVAFYVSKYLAKAPKKYEGCKRYWYSLNWRVEEEPPRLAVMDAARREVKLHPAAVEVHNLYCEGYRTVESRQGWWKLTPGGVPP